MQHTSKEMKKQVIRRRSTFRYFQSGFNIILCFTLIIVLGISCSDNPGSSDPDPEPEPDPQLGAVEVEIITTGGDENPPGILLSVEGSGTRNVGANEKTTISNLEPGTYQVQVSDIADHCTMLSENPQSVEITGSETASITFELNCIGILRNKLVFASFQNGETNIYKADPSGENRVQLTDYGMGDYWKIAVSPDGTKILFSSEGEGFSTSQIWMVDADGENLVNLTADPDRFHEYPTWSPDGSQIAYHTYPDGGQGEIFVMNEDGTGKTNITNTPGGEWWPDWSPDGSTIAFHVFTANGTVIIETIQADGTGRSVLFEDEEILFGNPSWSPDGSKIAFRSNIESEVSWEICVADADGSNINCLTDLANNRVEHRFPTWSPDGSQLAFDSNRDGNLNAYDIFVINADGSGLTNITQDIENSSFFPYWSQLDE